MNRPVNFKYHIKFGTEEIGNESIYHLLSTPFQVFNLPIPQHLPHSILAFSRILTELPGQFKFFRVNLMVTDYPTIPGRIFPLSGLERGLGGEGISHTSIC